MTTSPAGQGDGDGDGVLILDVDGTLLDTVYLHVVAWWEAFEEQGHQVSCLDIHRAIGRGSADLVTTLIGRADEAVEKGHKQRWESLIDRCCPFHDVPEFIRWITSQGVRVVLATSGTGQDTEVFRRKIGCDDVIHAVVSSADVGKSKPAPDIVVAALKTVEASPAQAMMVGDAVYDVQAAAAAGVPCIGLLCGGISEQELREAGAVDVFANISALLEAARTAASDTVAGAGSPLAAVMRQSSGAKRSP